MPEFIMDESGTVTLHGRDWQFSDLCDFTQGYVEALFFTEVSSAYDKAYWIEGESEIDGNIPGDSCFGDLHPTSLAKIIETCAAFELSNRALLDCAKQLEPGSEQFRYAREQLDNRRLGQLFYYASVGHGVGFDDNGNAPCLAQLQEAARYKWDCSVLYGESVDGGAFVFVEYVFIE